MLNKKVVFIFAIIIFALSATATYIYFSKFSKNAPLTTNYKPPVAGDPNTDNTSGTPTEECPMNGKLYSAAQKAKWEKRRVLGVMVENSLDARPQSGLNSSDVLYETVAEAGITRFLNIFYCDDAKILGPVRSARIYFLNLIRGYGDHPLYAHVGGANTPGPADALGTIRELGWTGYNDMDQFNVPYPGYYRDYDRLPNRATEHTMYTGTDKLWKIAAEKRKLSNVDEDGKAWNEDWKPWKFTDEASEGKRGDVAKINYGFWSNHLSSDYTVQWDYDKAENIYKRINGGQPHLDKNTNKQLEAKNVVVVFAEELPANDGYPGGHLLYDIIGSGEGLLFNNGQATEITWKKPKEEDMMRFYDKSGKEIALVRGKIWVSILRKENKVSYGDETTESTPATKKTTTAPKKEVEDVE